MQDFNVPPLRFDPVDSLTVRGEFGCGALSSDVGPLLLRSVDQQIGLTDRLASSIGDRRHTSYIRHEVADPKTQGVADRTPLSEYERKRELVNHQRNIEIANLQKGCCFIEHPDLFRKKVYDQSDLDIYPYAKE